MSDRYRYSFLKDISGFMVLLTLLNYQTDLKSPRAHQSTFSIGTLCGSYRTERAQHHSTNQHNIRKKTGNKLMSYIDHNYKPIMYPT